MLVLFTDGEDNDEGALEAAQSAAKAGLKIFTIGIGTAAGDLLRVTDANGNSDYVRDPEGNVVKSHLNEALLQQIAGATGGFYLPLRGANTIDTLYERGLAPLPKSEGKERLVRRYHEQYHWPLAAAILLLLAEMLLPERKRETSDPGDRQFRLWPVGPSREWRDGIHKTECAAAIVALLFCQMRSWPRHPARCANMTRAISQTRCRNSRGWRRRGRMTCVIFSTPVTRRIARQI